MFTNSDFCRNLIVSNAVVDAEGELRRRLLIEAMLAFRTVPVHPALPDHDIEAFGVEPTKHITFSSPI